MTVTPIRNPLPGEAAVGISPPLASEVDITFWRRRLNLFTGRALSDVALQQEQEHRAGRLAMLGQSVSAGVVGGLDVDVRVETGATGRRFHEIYVAPGLGLAATGEDITIPRALRVNVRDVPVYATSGAPARTLGAFLDAAGGPTAGVLVLQPAVAELRDDLDRTDPCEQDPESEAFEDWQIVDAARLVYFVWPNEWVQLPTPGARWRNRLAYALFGREMRLAPGEVPPWSEVGVPIALVAFDADTAADAVEPWAPLFVDRFSVVRAGGSPRPRTPIISEAGTKFLWQARIQQLAEHMADVGRSLETIGEIAAEFRYLPPVGLLPKQTVDTVTRRTSFFPGSYVIEAAPIPIEQLDTAVRASASLRAFDLTTADRVRVLVPVPQVFYEPRLLETDVPDPSFQTALDDFLANRAEWLQRRELVRGKAKAILKALTGREPEYPALAADPEALEQPEAVGTGTLDPPESAYGAQEGNAGSVVVPVFETLAAELRASAPWSTAEVSAPLAALPTGVSLPGSVSDPFKTRIRYDATRQLLFLKGVTTTVERDQLQSLAGTNAAWQAAIAQLHDRANVDFVELSQRGVEGFISYLEGKVRRADDRVDFGFLRIQTDIYRLRHVMLGATEATRLATSPVLASIAKGETAVATREDVNKFFAQAKGTVVERPAESGQTDSDYISYVRTLGITAAPSPAGPSGPGAPVAPAMAAPFSRALSGTRSETAALGGTTGFSGVSRLELSGGEINLTVARETTGVISGAGLVGVRAPSDIQLIEQQTSVSLPKVQVATTFDITQQAPIVGETYDFRTTTVAQRIESPPALEVKSFSVAGKYEVVSGLADLDMHLSDVAVAGLGGATTFGAVTGGTLGQILEGAFDPNPTNGDEADFFSRGVKALDDAVVTLRSVEGRIQQYRAAIERCRKVVTTLRTHVSEIDRRLKQIADDLAEARHDVSVARALLAEEIARVAAVNAHRAEIISKHVPFLAYVRTRLVDAFTSQATRPLNPGLTEAPVPLCLASNVPAPPELRAMVDLLRELPVRWFVHLPRLLDRFDRLDLLHGAVLSAKTRASFKVPGEAVVSTGIDAGGTLGQGVLKVFTAQQRVLANVRAQTAQLDLSTFTSLSWQQSKQQAEEVVSLGDLIDAGHGRTDVAQAAAREIDQIARVAACLYVNFGGVLPRIRLEWAERLSQYDDPITLRNLASLPRWAEITYLERREMQGLVDWLYSRLDAKKPEAMGLISDVIRVCILLASHSPVSQIIAGHLPKPTVVTPGKRIDVKVDLTRVRVGMHVLMYDQQQVVARGVVQDLASGLAAAHIVETFRPSVSLDAGARVQFSASDRFGDASAATLSTGLLR